MHLNALPRRPWRWLALACLMWLACLAFPRTALAQDVITARAWVEDPSGQKGLPEVQRLPLTAFRETLSRGYGAGVLWVRLTIDPARYLKSGPRPAELVLRMRPAYVDEVKVFDPLAPGGFAGVVGDRYHPASAALLGTDFLLPITLGEAPREVWLRLQSTSSRQLHVVALDRAALDMEAARFNLIVSLYLGAVMLLLAWGLVSAVLQRDNNFWAFAGMQATALLFGLSSLGVLRLFWPAEWSVANLSLAGSVFSLLVVTAGLWFHTRFLQEFAPARWVLLTLYGLLALAAVNLLALALGHEIWALRNNMASILLAPVLTLVAAITGRAWQAGQSAEPPSLPRWVLVLFYVVYLVIFLLASTTGLGLLPATEWTFYISQLQGVVSGILLMLVLQYRSHILRQQRQQVLLSLEKTTLEMQHERERRDEQERMLAMLAHEIRTPLATLHLRLDESAQGGLEMRKAMRDMNSVIERCLQTLKIEDCKLVINAQPIDLVAVVRDAVKTCQAPDRVNCEMPPTLRLHNDAQLLFILLSNLLENACKYSPPASVVTLRCRVLAAGAMSETVELAVSNLPGQAGWPDPDRVFEKYWRSPKAQRVSGTGLGLYLVHSLAQTLGGNIAYAPEPQQVRFVLTLPMSSQD